MERGNYITIVEISRSYGVEVDFIRTLGQHGLLEIVRMEEHDCVERDCLADIERLMRMHFELDINIAGVEAIWHLLARVKDMQEEIRMLRNRLGE